MTIARDSKGRFVKKSAKANARDAKGRFVKRGKCVCESCADEAADSENTETDAKEKMMDSILKSFNAVLDELESDIIKHNNKKDLRSAERSLRRLQSEWKKGMRGTDGLFDQLRDVGYFGDLIGHLLDATGRGKSCALGAGMPPPRLRPSGPRKHKCRSGGTVRDEEIERLITDVVDLICPDGAEVKVFVAEVED